MTHRPASPATPTRAAAARLARAERLVSRADMAAYNAVRPGQLRGEVAGPPLCLVEVVGPEPAESVNHGLQPGRMYHIAPPQSGAWDPGIEYLTEEPEDWAEPGPYHDCWVMILNDSPLPTEARVLGLIVAEHGDDGQELPVLRPTAAGGGGTLVVAVAAVSGSGLAAKYGLSRPKYVKADGTGAADVPDTDPLCDGTNTWARFHSAPASGGTTYTLAVGDLVEVRANAVDDPVEVGGEAKSHYEILGVLSVKAGTFQRVTAWTINQGNPCTITASATQTVHVFGVGLKIITS